MANDSIVSISLPHDAFVVSRLLYCSPQELQWAFETEYLGPIPKRSTTIFHNNHNKLKKIFESKEFVDDSNIYNSKFSLYNEKLHNTAEKMVEIQKNNELSNHSQGINMKNLIPHPVNNNNNNDPSLHSNPQISTKKTKYYHTKINNIKNKATILKKELNEDKLMIFKKIFGDFQEGELIKIQKMLVSVKLLSTTTNNKNLIEEVTDSLAVDYRTLERWKEYFVVVRTTGDLNNPFLVQFHTSRTIKKYDKHLIKGKTKDIRSRDTSLDFFLNSKDCSVNFYNTLDKSVGITVKDCEDDHEGVKVYIFKGHTHSSSIEWYLFIRLCLGIKRDNSIRIFIPDLNIDIDIIIPLNKYEQLLSDNSDSSKEIKLIEESNGYKVIDEGPSSFMIGLVLNKLMEIEDSFDDVSTWLNKVCHDGGMLGLTWRHYDTLNWIGKFEKNILLQYQALGSSHILELRNIINYPNNVLLPKNEVFQEPLSIEGFLKKHTGVTGNDLNGIFLNSKNSSKYFFSSKELLFFCDSNFALLPNFDIDSIFKLDENNHYSWLTNFDFKNFEKIDNQSLFLIKRIVFNLLKSQGIINLIEIKSIESFDNKKNFFKIIMNNNSQIILEAENENLKIQWINKIEILSSYWKLKLEEDISRINYIKQENLKSLEINEIDEITFIENAHQWELKKAISDGKIFNINHLSLLKLILMNGELYFKSRKHANFTKYYCILIPGYLLIYDIFSRKKFSNVSYSSSYYTHYKTISLNGCYIYSGNLINSDLLQRERNFDVMNPGNHAIPKIYLDGWKSCDDEVNRCFTIWLGTKKLINDHKKKIKLVSRLGMEGKTLIFMGRSRVERNLWINNIVHEIGRFNYEGINEEIEVI